MPSKEDKNFFVIGIGNPLRCDDGLGPLLAAEIAQKNIPGVKVIISQLLNLELLEDTLGYAKILVIDASAVGEGLVFKKVQIMENGPAASSHHLSPEFFLAMARELYEKDLSLYVCSLRGVNFEVGNTLSPQVLDIFPQALAEIEEFLKEK
jgi:hydrogenase maturation protease